MNEIKIKINLIEYYFCCLLFPIGGVVFATFLLIFALFGEVDLKFINGLIIFYICSISLAIVNFLICFIMSSLSLINESTKFSRAISFANSSLIGAFIK